MYSFSPHIKNRLKQKGRRAFPKLVLPSIGKIFDPRLIRSLKRIALADFELPRSRYLPDHISLVIFRAKFKRFLKLIPWFTKYYITRLTQQARRRKKAFSLALLLGLFILSVSWGLLTQIRLQAKVNQNKELLSLESKIEEAISLLKLNPLKVKNLVVEIETQLATLEDKNFDRERILGLKTRFEEFKSENFRIMEDNEFPLVYDFSFLNRDQVGTSLIYLDNSLALLDSFSGSFWRLNKESKKLETLVENSAELKESLDITSFGRRAYVLTLSGVYKFDLGSGKLELIIPKDSSWSAVSEIDTYQGNNLYLLDKGGGKIWKYGESNGQWGSKTMYFGSSSSTDLKSAVSMAIDGNVWLAFNDGGMIKLLRGKREDFSLTGLDSPFGENAFMYGNESVTNIYVLDRKKSRLVVLNKLGRLIKAYNAEVFSNVTSLSVDEKEKKIYLLLNKKIVMMDIK